MGKGSAGDLYLEVAFKPHPYYRIEGRDLYIDLPLAPWEAALGAKVKVPTPGGVVDLKIPPNSKSGRKLRLKDAVSPISRQAISTWFCRSRSRRQTVNRQRHSTARWSRRWPSIHVPN